MTQVEENTITKERIDFSEIKKWNVIFHNDDKTSMEFVIAVLTEIFGHTNKVATDLTHKIHEEGNAIVGNYIYEIAEQKASETLTIASKYSYPLKVTIEKE
jgi:ATP-dependent Clp protease adaptor protein ClpS